MWRKHFLNVLGNLGEQQSSTITMKQDNNGELWPIDHLDINMKLPSCVKISQAITGLLAQQPCNNTVNMIEQVW